MQTGLQTSMIFTFIIIIFFASNFFSLNVVVDEEFLRLKFGLGLIKKKFKLKDIIEAKSVKHHWYQGWGIRYWAPKKMWIFNISGFKAVDIKLRNNKSYRIGTVEPNKLVEAINQSLKL